MKYKLIALLISLIFINGCGFNDDDEIIDFTEANEEEIMDYIAQNNLDAQRTDSGLYFVINEQGTGVMPDANDNVTVVYKGYFTNGDVFDQSNENGLSFNLNQVIAGWSEGIPKFNEGGSGILLIPSSLGYGPFGIPGIPGGSVLVFDVELVSVNN